MFISTFRTILLLYLTLTILGCKEDNKNIPKIDEAYTQKSITTSSQVESKTESITTNSNKPQSKTITQTTEKTNSATAIADDTPIFIPYKDLTIYSQAMLDFIKMIKSNAKHVYEIIYIVDKNNELKKDFPSLNMPSNIGKSSIQIVNESEAKSIKNANDNFIFTEISGSIDKSKANFLFITSDHSFNHKFDCYLSYKINDAKNFKLLNSRFEMFEKRDR